jgi:hypothetical protein
MKKSKVKSQTTNDEDIISDRENYLKNRNNELEDFKNYLIEVKRDKPSVEGVICGMDFQQFSLACIFRMIKEQEEYTAYNELHPAPYIDIKEEKAIHKQMIKDAKKVFKQDYEKLYEFYNGAK